MGLPVVFHELYSAPTLRHGHRFPMKVFQEIYNLLLAQGVVTPSQIHRPQATLDKEILKLAHSGEYVDRFLGGSLDSHSIRQIGFGDEVGTKVLIDRTCSEVSGTLMTSLLALKHGLAVNCAGGTHHAFHSHGKGYCILNDLAITSKYLIDSGHCSRVLILDLDVHQGDGTAKILEDRPDIFTCSFHAARNFPAKKEKSDLDISLDDGCGDDEYLRILGETLPQLLKKFKPSIVLYDAGVDVHENDALGRLKITNGGLSRRENLVIDTVLGGFEIPLAGYVGGGYDDDLGTLAQRHLHLFSAASDAWSHHCAVPQHGTGFF